MPAILIDPFEKTVSPWEPQGAFLDALRATLECKQVDSIMVQDHIVLWFDNMGLLKPQQRYWRFSDNDHRFAGRSVLTAVDKDGMPCPLDLPENLQQGIDWCEGDQLIQIVEELVVEDTNLGPWPRVARKAIWSSPPEEDPDDDEAELARITATDYDPPSS